MRANNTPAGLSVLAECTTDVRQWCLQNGLQLNPDKSEALIAGTTNPAAFDDVIRVICVRGRSRPASSR